MTERKEEYRYEGKRSVGNKPCYIHKIVERADGRNSIYEFKAYPNWTGFTYKLCAANRLTKQKYPKPHIVSMDLVREYR